MMYYDFFSISIIGCVINAILHKNQLDINSCYPFSWMTGTSLATIATYSVEPCRCMMEYINKNDYNHLYRLIL